jgi:uncharacterized membrane protein
MTASVQRPVAARRWEVDALRGLAFLAMVIYHGAFDLAAFGGWPIAVTSGGWRLFADGIAGTFLFVAGISVVLARERWAKQPERYWWHIVRRTLRLGSAAGLVTLVTWLVSPPDVVLFGILHLILLSSLLALPFLRFGVWNFGFAGLAAFLGWLVSLLPGNPWLFWLGLVPEGYRSFDFRPLFPWFGVVLLGVGVASWWYGEGQRRWSLPDWSDRLLIRGLRWLGRHSLLLYLVHQPLLIAFFVAIGLIDVRRLLG